MFHAFFACHNEDCFVINTIWLLSDVVVTKCGYACPKYNEPVTEYVESLVNDIEEANNGIS